MATTRLYAITGLAVSNDDANIHACRGAWGGVDPELHVLSTSKADQVDSGKQLQFVFPDGTPGHAAKQFVFVYQLPSNQVIEGTLDLGFFSWAGYGLNPAVADMHWVVHAWVSAGTTGGVRGTILDNYTEATGVNNLSTSLGIEARQLAAPVALTPVSAQAGDYLVFEVGFVMQSGDADSSNMFMFGTRDSGGSVVPDLVSGDTISSLLDEDGKAGWIELDITPTAAKCSDGFVPQVEDPTDGSEWSGLGPHEDRFFVEIDLDGGTERYAMHDPMRDSPDLSAHPGFKEGRLLSCDAIVRRTTDRLGGWQASTVRFTLDDHDRRIRGLIAAGQWYNREVRIYLAKRTDVANAKPVFRGIIRAYPPQPGLTVDVEAVDIIGTEFSPFSLDRDILASVVFDTARTPLAPKELLDAKRPIPVYMGVWSDEASSYAGVPAWRPYPLRGGVGVGLNGYGDLVSAATPPTSVTATALPGGTLDPADTYNDEYGFLVTAIDADGNESDPYPFHMHVVPTGGGRGAFPSSTTALAGSQTVPKATIDGTQKIRVEWSGATGAVAYRCYIGTWYYLARYSHYIETTDEFCEWESLDSGDVARFTNPNLWWYVVIAKLADGVTGASAELGAIETGPRRIVRGWFTPVPDAVEYLVCRRGTVGGFRKLFHVPATQIEGGFVYFDDDQLATSGEIIDGLPVPVGMLPITDIGDEDLTGPGITGTWGKFALARWAWREILGVYAGGVRLSNTNANLLHADMAAWPFADRTVPLGDCDCMVLYLRGTLLEHQRDGTALVQVNACTTEHVGDGSGSTITQAARVVQHLVTELVRNDHLSGLWAGVPTFADGVAEIRTSSYAAAETMEIARVGGTGYTARVALTESTTLRTFIERVVQSFGLHHGINRHGQVVCGHYDDGVDTTQSYPHYTDVREIVGNIEVDPRTNELENKIPYEWDFRPITNAMAAVNLSVEDATAIAANRGKVNLGAQRSLPYAADQVTVDDVMQRLLLLGKYVREFIGVPVSIIGQSRDLFQILRLTDEEGLGSEGYREQFVLVLEHGTVPPDPSQDRAVTTKLRGLDITKLADAAFVWGPDSLADWDAMTDEERGQYAGYASDDDTIPSDDSPAKEWR